MDCSPPGSSVHRDSPGKNMEWAVIPSSRGSSQPRDQTQVSYIAGRFFTNWAIREAWVKLRKCIKYFRICLEFGPLLLFLKNKLKYSVFIQAICLSQLHYSFSIPVVLNNANIKNIWLITIVNLDTVVCKVLFIHFSELSVKLRVLYSKNCGLPFLTEPAGKPKASTLFQFDSCILRLRLYRHINCLSFIY